MCNFNCFADDLAIYEDEKFFNTHGHYPDEEPKDSYRLIGYENAWMVSDFIAFLGGTQISKQILKEGIEQMYYNNAYDTKDLPEDLNELLSLLQAAILASQTIEDFDDPMRFFIPVLVCLAVEAGATAEYLYPNDSFRVISEENEIHISGNTDLIAKTLRARGYTFSYDKNVIKTKKVYRLCQLLGVSETKFRPVNMTLGEILKQ